MERKSQIVEDNINAVLETAKKIHSSELPYGFSDRVISSLNAKPSAISRQLSPAYYPGLLRIAAMFILILANAYTLRLAYNQSWANYSANSAGPSAMSNHSSAISRFVDEYQMNDVNDEIVTANSIKHE